MASEQEDPIYTWTVAHPEKSEALAGHFVAVSHASELLDHDASFDKLYERVVAGGRLDLLVGRLPGFIESATRHEREARLTALLQSKPWKAVERHSPLCNPEIAELRALIEALARSEP
jgi:hypothetical protein